MKKKKRGGGYPLKAERAFRLVRANKLRKAKPKVLDEVALDATGHALIHKKNRQIALATIRSDRKLVQQLGNAFKVNGSYRIGRVSVREQ